MTGLSLMGVDVDNDLVTGEAAQDSSVWVNIHGSSDPEVEAIADADLGFGFWGWTAAFPGLIEPETGGYAYQPDIDGDRTQIDWPAPVILPPNGFAVDPVHNQVWGWGWPAGGSVRVEIADAPGGTMLGDWTGVPVDPDGNFWLDLTQDPAFDLLVGQHVWVFDEADTLMTKDTPVLPLTVDMPVAVGGSVVSGTADSGNGDVLVVIHADGYEPETAAFSNGDWSATLSQTLDYGMSGSAWQDEPVDYDGDRTEVGWWTPPAEFVVDPVSDVVAGGSFAALSEITVSIEGAGAGPWTEDASELGNFHLDLSGEFDIVPGDVVTVTDGFGTKTHTVTDLAVTGVDVGSDLVTGVAALDSTVWVYLDGVMNPGVEVLADTDLGGGLGEWNAAYPGLIDIDSTGSAVQSDPDGDRTHIPWQANAFDSTAPSVFGVVSGELVVGVGSGVG